jgi:hypothetical protein
MKNRSEMKNGGVCENVKPTFSNTGWISEYIRKPEFVTQGHDGMKMRRRKDISGRRRRNEHGGN